MLRFCQYCKAKVSVPGWSWFVVSRRKNWSIMYIERHVQMKLRRLYSIEYIQDLHDLRPKSDSIMRSRLSTVRQSRNCRVLKSKRYSRVRLSPKMVSSRPSSVAANFEDTFNAFRNYDEPITSDLQDHLLKCTLPDSHPTSSVLLMLDGSTASYKTKTDLAETPLAERFIHQHTLHKSHTSHHSCRQPGQGATFPT